MFERVVVGVSQSESGAAAIERAMELAQTTGGTLHLVSALAPKRPGPPVMPDEFRYSIGSLDPVDFQLTQLEARARAADIAVTTHAVLADPVTALTQVASEERADLIVVGASDAHGVRHRDPVSDALAEPGRLRRPRRLWIGGWGGGLTCVSTSRRCWVRWPGPAQRPLVNRVRVGRQQLSAGKGVCRSQPGRRTEHRPAVSTHR